MVGPGNAAWVGRFDCGSVYVWGAPLAWKDRVLLFYNGLPITHDGARRYPRATSLDTRAWIGVAEFDRSILE